MSQFILGTSVTVFDPPEGMLADKLPAKVFSVQRNPMSGVYYLDYGVELPKQLERHYGDLEERAERILNTYLNRGKSTGVALTGFKGTGKSLLAREVCRSALSLGIPVIMVNKGFGGEEFCTFIASIKQKAIILFEEFDKNFSASSHVDNEDEDSDQTVNSILSLLDGIYNSDKLYLFTSNSGLPYYLHNRPSRVYYHYEYAPVLDSAIVEGYCKDNLHDPSDERIQNIVTMTAMAYEFSFDMLQAVVEEANRYPNQKIKELVQAINVDAQLANADFRLTFFYKPEDGSKETDITNLFGYVSETILDGYSHNFYLTCERPSFDEEILKAFPVDVVDEVHEQLEENNQYLADKAICKHLGAKGDYIRSEANSFQPTGKNLFVTHPTERIRIEASPIKGVKYDRYAY